MSDGKSKIITTFQDRLEINSAVRELGQAANDAEMRQRAAEIAQKYGDKALPALLAMLDTSSPQLRGGLGRLATLLNPDTVIPALRNAALNRRLSDQARMTAITLLDRFLGIKPEDAMYAGMVNPEELALESLREVLVEAQTNRLVLLEYLTQLAEEPPDVLLTMVRSTASLPGTDGVELLRMFAQDPYQPAAEEALHALGNLADPTAAAALQSVTPTLSPELRSQGERSLQKLRLRGVPVSPAPPPPAGARCLASPPDGQGSQLLWFLLPRAEGPTSDILQVLLSEVEGVSEASGGYDLPNEGLPSALPRGNMHEPGTHAPLLLEAPFDYGRRLVSAALERNWEKDLPTPLPYRLFNPLLWQWTRPEPAPKLPEPPTLSRADTVELWSHPALRAWHFRSKGIDRAARRFLRGAEAPTSQNVSRAVAEALRRELAVDTHLVPRLQQRLLALQEWLAMSGDLHAAGLAAAAAHTLGDQPESHPFLLQLAGAGLRVAMILLAGNLEISS